MQNLTPQIIGLHVNDTSSLELFKSGKKKLLESIEDGIWLGNGMYFWDNEANAEYWIRNKQTRFPNLEFAFVKVLLSLECLLDLSDKNHTNLCKEILNNLIKKGVDKSLKDKGLGAIINTLFTESTIFQDHFTILKIHGLYNWEENKFIVGNDSKYKNKSRPSSVVKTIYCVKSEKVILHIL